MQNLSQKELRIIAKNRNISGYKNRPKDKLLRLINNNGKIERVFLNHKKVFIGQ